jgi:hypothetical protein
MTRGTSCARCAFPFPQIGSFISYHFCDLSHLWQGIRRSFTPASSVCTVLRAGLPSGLHKEMNDVNSFVPRGHAVGRVHQLLIIDSHPMCVPECTCFYEHSPAFIDHLFSLKSATHFCSAPPLGSTMNDKQPSLISSPSLGSPSLALLALNTSLRVNLFPTFSSLCRWVIA